MTDYTVSAWMMNVFVLPEQQGNSYGKVLIGEIKRHPKLNSVTRRGLNTLDAHELYKQFGFTELKDPSMYMELNRK